MRKEKRPVILRTSFPTLLAIVGLAAISSSFAESNARMDLGDVREIIAADFNHDSSRVIGASRNGAIGLWDVNDGKVVTEDPVLDQWSGSYAMSADGKLVLLIGKEGAQVLDATTGALLSPLLKVKLRSGLMKPALFSPDNTTLLVFEQNEASIWNVKRGEKIASIPLPEGPHDEAPPSAIFTSAGAACFVMDPDGTVTRYETKTWKRVGKPMRHPRLEMAYEFGFAASPDGRFIATFDGAGENGPKGELQVWDASTNKSLGAPLVTVNSFSARFIPGVDSVVIQPARGDASVRELPSMKMAYTISKHDELDGPKIEVSPDGKWIASWGPDKILHLIDAKSGKMVGNTSSNAAVTKVLFGPDSALYVVYDNTAFLLEKYHDNYIMKLKLPELTTTGSMRILKYLNNVSLSPNGDRVLVQQGWTNEEQVVIFDSATMKALPWSHERY